MREHEHERTRRRRRSALQRFEAKVCKTPGGCWLWTAAKNNDGYGSFWSGEYRGDDYRNGPIMLLAHRWSYEHFIGPIPEDLGVLHRCDTPGCVNPEHFFLGTQAANVKDCAAKGRRNQARPGRAPNYHKLSAEIHDDIRRCLHAGDATRRELADHYGVATQTIDYIVRRRPAA